MMVEYNRKDLEQERLESDVKIAHEKTENEVRTKDPKLTYFEKKKK